MTATHHPTPAQCEKIAAVLELAHATYPGTLCMHQEHVYVDAPQDVIDDYGCECGSHACHAGHFLLGLHAADPEHYARCAHTAMLYRQQPRLDYETVSTDPCDNDDRNVDYSDGALAIAHTLGFLDPETGLPDPDALEIWARDHAEYWGSTRGNSMFTAETAFLTDAQMDFGSRPKVDVPHIATWWRDVGSRLPEPEPPAS